LRNQDLAQVSRFDHAANLLDNRVVTQIVLNAIRETFVGRKIHEFARLLERNGEGLLAQDVFPGLESRTADRMMQRVGCQNMDSVDAGIFEQLLIISSGPIDSNALTELARAFFAGAGHRRNFDSAQAPQIFRVHLSHETGPDESCLQIFHKVIGWVDDIVGVGIGKLRF
jgi:hypothetical protein